MIPVGGETVPEGDGVLVCSGQVVITTAILLHSNATKSGPANDN